MADNNTIPAPELEAAETSLAAQRKFKRALLLISAAALILRIIAAIEMCCFRGGENNVFMPPPTSDLATYMQLGSDIAGGNFPKEFYYQPFYYTVFLGALNFLFGKWAIYAVITAQTLLSAVTVYLAGWCADRVFKRHAAGVITAVMCAISSPLLLYVPFHQNETLQTFNLILLLALLLQLLKQQRTKDFIYTGLAAGVAILTRGNIWLLLPAVILIPVVVLKKQGVPWRTILSKTAIFFAVLLVLQLPFIWHNSRSRGEFTGPSTAANAVLALGNNQEAPAGGREKESAGAMYYPEAYRRMMARSSAPGGASAAKQMWERFCDEPLVFAELQFRKLLIFWDSFEIPNNVSMYVEGKSSMLIRYLLPGRTGVLLSIALAGLFYFLPRLKRQREPELYAAYGFVLLYYGAVTVFYMLSRFRAPILPVLFIFGGGVAAQWYSDITSAPREKRYEVVSRRLLVYIAALFFVAGAYPMYRINLERPLLRLIQSDGIILDNGGSDIQYFDHGPRPFGGWREIKAEPGMIIAKVFSRLDSNTGMVYLALGNSEAAEITLKINDYPLPPLKLPPIQPGNYMPRFYGFPGFTQNGTLTLEVVDVKGEVALVYDTQRNYYRSNLNGSLCPGEWVIRFGKRD